MPIHGEALVFIKRGRKGNVRDRSVQRFEDEDVMHKLWKAAEKFIPGVEVYKVSIQKAIAPDKQQAEVNRYWCPYCGDHRKLEEKHGYKVCEVCHISTQDFYSIKYNGNLYKEQLKEIEKGMNSRGGKKK